MNKFLRKSLGLSLLAATAVASQAEIVVLDFEGIGDGVPVGEYYNGVGGPDYDISFSANSLALTSGNFANNPSPDAIMFFLSGTSATMNVPNGFDTGFSFFYAGSQGDAHVDVYSEINQGGTLLASIPLPATPAPYSVWVPVGVAFEGIAKSVDFVGAADFIGFDNITFGTEVPVIEAPVPEPATVFGGLALGVLALRRGLRRK